MEAKRLIGSCSPAHKHKWGIASIVVEFVVATAPWSLVSPGSWG